ncbi:restriction endonuclease subunit S [Halomonas piscis]|uniref:restriction endonuclease subunit S n=1 Tax=Halomonas piscis TaxID=3031727 RepID=UPI0028A17F98|nr:restriction endonuclease subunit S [Halomonas piscis]
MAECSEAVEEQAVRDASAAYSVEAGAVTVEDVPPGYKRTEVGVIPEDWICTQLGDAIELLTGFPFSSSRFSEAGTLLVRGSNVKRGQLDWSEEITKFWEEITPELLPYQLEEGDLVIAMDGALVGRSFAVISEADLPALLVQRVARIRSTKLNQWYIVHWVASEYFHEYVDSVKTHTAIPHISPTDIRGFLISAPGRKEEQRAIATALSDADALIDSLDRLIAKKRAIKKAATQQLLTGQTRLPGFTGEWETKRLGEVAHIKTGSRNNEDKVQDGPYPFFVRSELIERIDTYSHDCEAILVPGEGRIGEIFHYIQGRFDVHQRVYAITRFTSDVSGQFIYFYMAMYFGSWAMQNTVKATVDSLRLPTFQNFLMVIPPTIAEQTAIATVLSDMDSEIEALNHRRYKARQLKQGMMQQLLTGRVRLVEPEVENVREASA